MNYHDYIWDLGGTLLDNYELSTQAFQETLAAFNLSGDAMVIHETLKESTEAAINKFAPQEKEFLKVYKANEAKKLTHPIWCSGAEAILKKVVASGGRNFLVTHRDDHVHDLLAQAGLSIYFEDIITSSNGFARKPNPESLLYLKETYNISNALVIGDRDIDSQAGQAAGFDTLLVDGRKSLLEIVN